MTVYGSAGLPWALLWRLPSVCHIYHAEGLTVQPKHEEDSAFVLLAAIGDIFLVY